MILLKIIELALSNNHSLTQQYFSYMWWSVLLVGGIGGPRENNRPVASHWQTISHNVVSSTSRHVWESNSQLQWR